VNKTRSCNYSLDAPDAERYRSKHAQQPRNKRIISYPTQLHLVGHFIRIQLLLTGGKTAIRSITEAAQERTNKKSHLKQHYNITILKEKIFKRDYLFLHIMIAKFHSI